MVKTITTNDVSLEEIAKVKDIPSLETDITTNANNVTKIQTKTDWVDPRDHGAVMDGVTDDTIAVRAAIKYAEDNKKMVRLNGIFKISGEIEVKQPITIEGVGNGEGYSSDGIAGYVQKSGFLVTGTGTKRVRTRYNHRASSADPQDPSMSVALNIQAEGVKLKNFSVFLYFDQTNTAKDHYGDDWDIGVFVGCRPNFKADDVHVMGYWREASFWFDVTHAKNLPRFNDLTGNPYPNGANTSGGDGCRLLGCMAWGGKWGIRIQGAKPASGQTTYSTAYYDELLGMTITDNRGTFGFSDFSTYECKIHGTDHHSSYRRNKATGNYLTDTAGGAMYVDGLASNSSNSVWGHRHYSTRFASFEPYRIKLDRTARIYLYGCHIEKRSGTRYNQDETSVAFTDSDTYGFISATANTNHLFVEGSPVDDITVTTFMPSSVKVHNMFPTGTSLGSRMGDKLYADGFGAITGELDLRSATSTDDVRLRQGSTSFALLGKDSGWRSTTDNTTNVGTASNRFAQIFATTGAINTSDERAKQQIQYIPDAVLDAWADVNFKQFKFNDAVALKGDAARWHFGVIAQQIRDVFISHNLDAFSYGLLCYDEWDDIYETNEETGEDILVIPAGNRYSIRPTECQFLEIALQRRTNERFEARLQVLENPN